MMDKWEATNEYDDTEDHFKSVIENYEAIYTQLTTTDYGVSTGDYSHSVICTAVV